MGLTISLYTHNISQDNHISLRYNMMLLKTVSLLLADGGTEGMDSLASLSRQECLYALCAYVYVCVCLCFCQALKTDAAGFPHKQQSR